MKATLDGLCSFISKESVEKDLLQVLLSEAEATPRTIERLEVKKKHLCTEINRREGPRGAMEKKRDQLSHFVSKIDRYLNGKDAVSPEIMFLREYLVVRIDDLSGRIHALVPHELIQERNRLNTFIAVLLGWEKVTDVIAEVFYGSDISGKGTIESIPDAERKVGDERGSAADPGVHQSDSGNGHRGRSDAPDVRVETVRTTGAASGSDSGADLSAVRPTGSATVGKESKVPASRG